MGENKYKESHRKTPVEKHTTAAWADKAALKDVSGVSIPDEMEVIAAKEFVDENEK